MRNEIEEENARRIEEIRNAQDRPTTAALMHVGDAWWKRYRRWDPESATWVSVD